MTTVAIFPRRANIYIPIHPSSRGADSWESGPWDYSSSLFSSPSLYFSPFSRFTHLEPYGLRSLKLGRTATAPCHNLAPGSRKPSKQFPTDGGVVSGHQLTLSYHYNRGSASVRGPIGGDQRNWRRKRQRQKHTHLWQQFTRAQIPGSRFPAKFGCQPIKLEQYPLAHTHPANYLRVQFRHLGVYKGSPVAHRAIRVRVS